ncbi:L-serine dehydratase [Glutamicibacter uratoxydans]|uniref:L-serine dehydratase n=1 Tax=Glutamicibacter uratoxydans TaxID=43667 RepID=A0A4Y4DRN6_GLUUR|nr:L-serine ammonia-lyase [Glutamicibacter uratoxydans]GED05161.1 L-serine dehydratase [Glutamicibacter uratoxydans]
MALSVLDMFSIGIGPSSSHTVGPMRAAKSFVAGLDQQTLVRTARVAAQLFGSLGATGIGHHSDSAVVLGLAGYDPATVDTAEVPMILAEIKDTGRLHLGGVRAIDFDPAEDVVLHRRKSLPGHPNAMTFSAYDAQGALLAENTAYSIGGGFVVDHDALNAPLATKEAAVHEFSSAAQLLELCQVNGESIAGIMWRNELSWRSKDEVDNALLHIWEVMQQCVENGCDRTEPTLPGGLMVTRRAPGLRAKLEARDAQSGAGSDPLAAMEWVNLFALAVNEESASGGRIVTAPTNGAAGIIPAVLHYYTRFVPGATDDKVIEFLMTAAAIGILIKTNASISGAEVGCQGEVGSACAMAAAGLCAVLGGTPEQVENAAEVALEHNLGLTCDPVGGLVQIPCIERNAIASVKAINAARLALHGDGEHSVSLDQAIETMRATGADMKSKYKETSRGGLALTLAQC